MGLFQDFEAQFSPAYFLVHHRFHSLQSEHSLLASATETMSSGAYEKVKANRLTFKDGTLATRAKPIDKKKKKKKSKNTNDDGFDPRSDDVIKSENEAQIHLEGTESGSGEVIYTIDAAKKMKYDELFPVEAKKFSYDPKAKVKSVEQALDDRVKKKADRYCK